MWLLCGNSWLKNRLHMFTRFFTRNCMGMSKWQNVQFPQMLWPCDFLQNCLQQPTKKKRKKYTKEGESFCAVGPQFLVNFWRRTVPPSPPYPPPPNSSAPTEVYSSKADRLLSPFSPHREVVIICLSRNLGKAWSPPPPIQHRVKLFLIYLIKYLQESDRTKTFV